MPSERLSDEEVHALYLHHRGFAGGYEIAALANEVMQRRAAERTHIGRVAALAQSLPVDEEADRMAAGLMSEHYEKQPTRKLGRATSCECWSQPHAGFCPAREG